MRTVETKLNKTGEIKTASVFKPTAEESFFKGNQAGFFSGLPVQAKLKVGASDDFYEREADAMADKVMRMPEPQVQRSCSSCSDKKREDELNRKPLADTISRASAVSSDGGNVSPGVESAIRSSAGGGQSLPDTTRSFMESRFGTDFSGVNIHTDSNAVQLNQQLGARAFTYGNDVFFNRGEYNPSSSEGKHLLAHELTHMVQQHMSISQIQRKNEIGEECSEEIKTQIETGIKEAKILAKTAIITLKKEYFKLNSVERSALNDIFESPNQDTREKIKNRYENILRKLDNKIIHCKDECTNNNEDKVTCAKGDILGNNIYICPSFGGKNICDPGKTILHEAAHNEGCHHGENGPFDNAYAFENFAIKLKRKELPKTDLGEKKEFLPPPVQIN